LKDNNAEKEKRDAFRKTPINGTRRLLISRLKESANKDL